MSTKEPLDEILSRLNDQQRLAVLNTDKQILCLAGAGTGKTHCMISRIRKLVEVDKVDPRSILVLTFTNAAAFEMQKRYGLTAADKRYTPEFRTFHGFCYNLMIIDRDVRKALGYARVPTIATDADIKYIHTTAKLQSGCRLSDSQLQKRDKISPSDMFAVSVYDKQRKKLFVENNMISFDDLSEGVCELFTKRAGVIHKYLSKYKYIFVDEFQDTDQTQYDFIRAFNTANIFVVGDISQAIYGFRGADSTIIKSLISDPSWAEVQLQHNYRSTKEICNYANKAVPHQEGKIEIFSTASGPEVEKRPIGMLRDTEQDLIDLLTNNPGEWAILCRTNIEVGYISKVLSNNNIESTTTHIADHTEDIIKSAYDVEYELTWLSSFLNQTAYSTYVRYRYLFPDMTNEDVRKWFIDQYSDTCIDVREYASLIENIRHAIYTNVDMQIRVGYVTYALQLPEQTVSADFQFPNTASEMLELITSWKGEEVAPIYVGTIHSVKGLEYENVVIWGLSTKSFQIRNTEDENCLYVAITRAKNRLIIYVAEEYM